MERIPELIKELPELPRTSAEAAWKDYGEVVLCDSDEEMAKVSDEYAPEHLEVHAENLDWWLKRLKNYGSFIFERRNNRGLWRQVFFGTNHILPTKGGEDTQVVCL